ncbi:MAG TPA: DUF927 domain-containing protein [Burkholderiaceae bacterium]|nr:DUF927 domain-containing protein [Burkholderiaceae bacterium]
MAETIERAQELLGFISAECERERWVNVGMALHDQYGEEGWELFDGWSAESDQYNPGATRAVWKSFKAGGGRGFGTLVQYAKEDRGYDPKKAKHKKQQVSPEVAAEQAAKAAARRALHDKEEAEEAAAAALRAQKRWDEAKPASPDHPYPKKKGVKTHGLRVGKWRKMVSKPGEPPEFVTLENVLQIPMRDRKGGLHGLQGITATGEKLFMFGAAKKGHFFKIGAAPLTGSSGKPVAVFAEGFATAASIHEATGHLVFCCFDLGNKLYIARETHARQGDRSEIILACDNDTETRNNPGRTRATALALELGLLLAVPPPGDFNDLAQTEGGAEAIVKAIAGAAVPTELFVAPEATPAVVPRDEVPTIDEYPCYRVFDEWVLGPDGECYQPGVHYFGTKKGRGKDAEPEPYSFHVCGPLRLLAQTQAAGGVSNYGRQLAWTTTTGINQTWAMPARMLNADGKEIRARLLEGGLYINPEAQRELHKYISQSPSMLKLPEVMCVQGTGWNSNLTAFALYTRTLGPQAAKVIFQSEFIEQDPYATRGSLAGWRQGVAMPAFKNSAMTLAICLGFAGPMLALLQAESGGVHLWGESSKGKTTLLHAATSIWGHPEEFMKSWNTTVNGVEGAAAVRTHTLMTLDEIHQANPEEVGKIAYMLGNGEGKQRANIGGEARAVRRFLVSVLSSGEKSAEAAIGSTGNNITAGQAVRLVDINVTDRTYGVFDELHDHAGGGGLSETVKAAAKAHHGHAGPALVEHLCKAEVKSDLQDRYTALKTRFKAKAQGPQEERVAARMALYALAGELATEAGLTGWPVGWAAQAVEAEYARWWAGLAVRGHGDREPRQIVQALHDFLQAYGEARFESAAGAATERVVPNRAGWKKFDGQKWLYYFTSKALGEATAGYAFSQVLKTLDDNGVLITQPSRKAGGRRSSSERIGSSKRKEIVYVIDSERLSSLIDGGITGH